MAFTYGEYSESGDYTIKEKKVRYVEYIESDGASYIDTGLSQDSTTVDTRRYEYSMMWNEIPNNGYTHGIVQNTWNQLIGLKTNSGNGDNITFSGIFGISNNSQVHSEYSSISASYDTKYDIIMDYLNSHVEISNENETLYISDNFTKGENNYPLCTMRIFIGKDNNIGTPETYMKGRIYYFRAYENNELIQDLRPCLDDNDIPCMYDEVSRQYFYNQGTGTFDYKKTNLYLFADNQDDVAINLGNYRLYNMKIEGDSEGIENGRNTVDYVEYLQGDGASWIDTGIITNENTQIEVTSELINFNNYKSWFGSDRVSAGYQVQAQNLSFKIQDNGISRNLGNTTYTLGKHTWKIDTSNIEIGTKKYAVNIDGVDLIPFTPSKNENPTMSLKVFSANTHGDSGGYLDANDCCIQGRIYDFKIYMDNELIMHLKPCLNTSKVPCMYDEISKQYFYNQGTGTFGYKKKLRDFQPVLDSNEIPCLLDKVNRKYYYNQGTGQFATREQNYKRVSYLQGDGNSWINTSLKSNTMAVNSYSIEIKRNNPDNSSLANQGIFGVTDVNNVTGSRTFGEYYNYGYFTNGGMLSYEDINNSDGTKTGKYIANSDTSSNVSSQAEANVYLFALNALQDSTAIKMSNVIKIYYYKVWDGDGNLIQHFIPVLDQDNIPCMYDLVTKTFFYNQGTGEFSYGIEELECPPIDYVDYVTSYSASYRRIPLDFSLNSYTDTNMSYEYKATFHDNQNISMPIGINSISANIQTPLYFSRDSSRALSIRRASERVQGFNISNYNAGNTYILSYNVQGNQEILANGENVGTLDTSVTMGGRGNLILFDDCGQNSWTNGNKYWYGDFYYFRIWDSGNLIHEILPCLDDNGEVAVYDTVTGKLYQQEIIQENNKPPTSVGINPTPIKYIESNGTQYIDTGVEITNNTDIEMNCRKTTMIDYISNGLIFNLDGINNTRNGHVSDATVWEDLSGNGLDFDLNNITIADNCMSFDGSSSYANIQDIELWKTIANSTTEYDVELCFRFTLDETYQPIISSNYGSINVAKFVKHLQFRSTTYGFNLYNISGKNYATNRKSFTVSCNMNDLLAYFNTTNYTLDSQATDFIGIPTSDNFTIGTRLTGERFWFNGDIYSIRIYNRHLTDEERLYNHSVDVARFGVETDIITVKTGNCIMNGLYSQETYKYQDTDTTVQPNLTTSEGATLTLGETYLSYLSEEEIEDATNDGWNLL